MKLQEKYITLAVIQIGSWQVCRVNEAIEKVSIFQQEHTIMSHTSRLLPRVLFDATLLVKCRMSLATVSAIFDYILLERFMKTAFGFLK